MAKKPVELLKQLGVEFGFNHESFSTAVQDVITMGAAPARKLLKRLFDFKIIVPKKIEVVRFTLAHLLQKELKHRSEYGTSLMPFTERDFNGALRKGKISARDAIQ